MHSMHSPSIQTPGLEREGEGWTWPILGTPKEFTGCDNCYVSFLTFQKERVEKPPTQLHFFSLIFLLSLQQILLYLRLPNYYSLLPLSPPSVS